MSRNLTTKAERGNIQILLAIIGITISFAILIHACFADKKSRECAYLNGKYQSLLKLMQTIETISISPNENLLKNKMINFGEGDISYLLFRLEKQEIDRIDEIAKTIRLVVVLQHEFALALDVTSGNNTSEIKDNVEEIKSKLHIFMEYIDKGQDEKAEWLKLYRLALITEELMIDTTKLAVEKTGNQLTNACGDF